MLNSKSILAVTLVSISVVMQGCSPTARPYSYTKTPLQARNDTDQCRKEAGITVSGGGFVFFPLILVAPIFLRIAAESSGKEKVYLDCMRGKGYEIRPVNQ